MSEPPMAVASLRLIGSPRPVPFVTARFGLSCANGSEIGFSNQIDRPFVLELGEIEDRRNESEK